jgi:FixJ family two-component response regulator
MMLVAIIDDDEPLRTGLASLVRAMGYAVHLFASAQDFLGTADIATFDCVITDVQMPRMNGVELLRALTTAGHHLPVIFITAFPNDKLMEEAQTVGAAGIFSKPFHAESLAQCLAGACTRRSP